MIHLILDHHEIDWLSPLCDICKVPSINRRCQGVPNLTSYGTECPKQVSGCVCVYSTMLINLEDF